MLLQYMLDPPRNTDDEAAEIDRIGAEAGYTPTEADNKTSLIIFDSEKRMSGSCFMIARMIPTERRLVFMPIPADTCARLDGTENSIYEYYRMSGSQKAVKAAEAIFGTEIDYYLKLNNESFSTLVNVFGGVEYNIPYNLIYSNPDTGEEIIFREGETYLESDGLRKLLTYPLYNGGEEYRAKVMGVAVTDLVNKNIAAGFSSHIDDYFSIVINSPVETNFTAYDYQEQSEAMKYIAESYERIASFVSVTGTYNEKSFFVLDESFLQAVPEWLKLETDFGDEAAVTTEFVFPQ